MRLKHTPKVMASMIAVLQEPKLVSAQVVSKQGECSVEPTPCASWRPLPPPQGPCTHALAAAG
jgi:hypothetical protein